MADVVAKIIEITHPIITPLSKLEHIAGILCFGSYALGTYDLNSDIDLFVLCEPDIITETTRQHIFTGIPTLSHLQLNDSSPGWTNQWSPQSDKFKLAQTDFDISYNTKDWISRVVHKVIDQGATSMPELTFRPYTMLGLLARAIILYDPQSFIKELRSCLYPYPPKLKARLV